MAETTITAPPSQAAPVSTFTEFNVRQEEGKPHFIRLQDRVVRALERQLATAAGDVFGVLLGSVENQQERTIHVEGFEPSVHHEQGMLNVVGYYRAHSGEDFTLDAVDMARYEHWFPENTALALLLKRPKTGHWTAVFFLGEDGRLTADRSTVEFPFDLHELGAEEPALAQSPVTAAQLLSSQLPPPRKPWKTALASTAVIGGLIGLYTFHRADRQPPAKVETPARIAEPAGRAAGPEVEPPVPSALESGSGAAALATPPAKVAAATPPTTKPAVKKPAPALEDLRASQSLSFPAAPPAVAPAEPQLETAPVSIAATSIPAPIGTVPAAKPPEPGLPLIAPRPIRQFAPVVKDDLRRAIRGEAMIRLRVYVDRTGKVTAADPLNATSRLADGLAAAAIASVKRWQFEPARRGDEKVPGEIELTFTFRK